MNLKIATEKLDRLLLYNFEYIFLVTTFKNNILNFIDGSQFCWWKYLEKDPFFDANRHTFFGAFISEDLCQSYVKGHFLQNLELLE